MHTFGGQITVINSNYEVIYSGRNMEDAGKFQKTGTGALFWEGEIKSAV